MEHDIVVLLYHGKLPWYFRAVLLTTTVQTYHGIYHTMVVQWYFRAVVLTTMVQYHGTTLYHTMVVQWYFRTTMVQFGTTLYHTMVVQW
jgi:hypothetical protein